VKEPEDRGVQGCVGPGGKELPPESQLPDGKFAGGCQASTTRDNHLTAAAGGSIKTLHCAPD